MSSVKPGRVGRVRSVTHHQHPKPKTRYVVDTTQSADGKKGGWRTRTSEQVQWELLFDAWIASTPGTRRSVELLRQLIRLPRA